MKFTKMEGLGNDYVYVNCFRETVDNPSEVAKKVSDRHFGIGSDGLILIKPSEVADFRMDMYNADGSQAEMCGNGIRCVAKYVYDYGLTDKTSISIETLAGHTSSYKLCRPLQLVHPPRVLNPILPVSYPVSTPGFPYLP